MMQLGKKLSACVLLSGLFAGPAVQAEEYSADSAAGKPAPEITVGQVWNTTGIPNNSDLKGKAVLLEFYDTR
ncbi:MAG: hypothetical protein O3B01_22070 [Planctomycetota bacterium]|nr:hypothetical protein [Planctomycetota bacterium]